ncbi:hypothetical protein M2302_001709 [Micromonospora sp. A200]|uniref:hypothetical protein n=1 Tax=Micromonospora sp. A200 TaxID=2940568 RepID=UPI0024741C59|nr:hypothetical protein [Micromonospora sp. A200]MDH6461539.1 hypothetical protein [Micromonospora sp. A200]
MPVVAGKVSIHNASSGTTHDLAGFYGSVASGATDGYVPLGPQRIVDTRQSIGLEGRTLTGQLNPREKVALLPASQRTGCPGGCPAATAAVLNLTVTRPSAAGVLTVYPETGAAPRTSTSWPGRRPPTWRSCGPGRA